MPILTSSLALLIGLIVAPTLFILFALLTHATYRHIVGAILGAVLYGVVNYAWDHAAAEFGWWTYPGWSESGQFPLAGYLLAGIVGGGAFGLVGWRMIRRWHWRGYLGFLLFWAIYALIHDYGGSLLFASSRLMVFRPGLIPVLADVLWYISGDAMPPLVIWLIGDAPYARNAV
jgi:hypothetical protein